MAALLETQKPFLERDVRCGNLPPRHYNEDYDQYIQRMAILYHLPELVVRTIITV